MSKAWLALVLTSAFSSGCYRFTVVSGRPASPEPQRSYNEHLHSAIVGDVVTIDPPYRINQICPSGWARIDRTVSGFAGLLDILAGGVSAGILPLYQADVVTVYCNATVPVSPGAASASGSP
jgi:hypothetical protein